MSADISNFTRLEALLPELFQSNQLTGKSYLRTQLTPETNVLLPMESVQESLLVNDREITLIPNMPSYFLGLMNLRDRVFGLIDLPNLLGLSNQISSNQKTYHTVVIRVDENSISDRELLMGFVFYQVRGLIRVTPGQLKPPCEVLSKTLERYVSYSVQENQNQQIPILNLQAVINNLNVIQN